MQKKFCYNPKCFCKYTLHYIFPVIFFWRCNIWTLTWHAGDAKHVRVANEEVLQNVSGLVGVDDYDLRGGVCGGTDPHQAGEFILKPEFLFLLLNTQCQILNLKHKGWIKSSLMALEPFFFLRLTFMHISTHAFFLLADQHLKLNQVTVHNELKTYRLHWFLCTKYVGRKWF